MSSKSSPSSFRNLRTSQKHSPVEIKEKLRKNYKEKIRNSRLLLFDKLRGSLNETQLHETLKHIYQSMFDLDEKIPNEEEDTLFEDIKSDLVKEEMEWWMQEYDKCKGDIDWSHAIDVFNVICPVCQKTNLLKIEHMISCPICNITIKTNKELNEIENILMYAVENHSNQCHRTAQFVCPPIKDDEHIYLMCENCNVMQIVI